MSLINFTNLDYDQIRISLRDYLKANSNFTDYDFEGSNLSTILSLLAYNTYLNSYNTNMISNEVFLNSATLRENVVYRAEELGYLPRSKKAARATISFFVNTESISPAPSTVTLKAGPIASTTGSFGNSSFVFSILKDITVPVVNNIANFTNIEIYEGIVLQSNFTYSADVVNQRFILPNSGIDTSLLSVSVRKSQQDTTSVQYNAQFDLFNVNSDSKIFFLREIEDEQYELLFGDGVFGTKLENNNYIETKYIVTNGDSANGINSFAFSGIITYTRNSIDYNVTTGISLVTTESTSSGGESIESVSSIQKYAPRMYAAQNRALTTADYETLIPTKIYPDAESISVFGGEEVIPPQYGKVFISIKPRNGDFLPNLIKENIKTSLKQYSVAGIVPEILDLKYLYIEVDSKIYYNTSMASSAAQVSTIVQQNVTSYAESSELNRYGARFKYSKFLKIIDDSSAAITSNITTVTIRRDLRVVINSFAEYSIGFGNAFHIASASGYNIHSSAFTIAGYTQTLYLSDIPNSDQKTGSLFFFTVPNTSSQSPTIIKRNVGIIDYENGILTLNPVNILSTSKSQNGQPIIQISAVPQSNDVIGLRDLYLQLDINNSNFEMISDTSSNYIVSSSYNSGNLVRS
jgi:hypothetical protein